MINFFKKKKPIEHNPNQPVKWPTHVTDLHQKDFNEFINKYPLTLIDFWAPWCNPCRTMLPRFRRLERLYQGKVAFGRVNSQQHKDIAEQYKIMGIPHFGVFRYGKKVGSITGVKSVGAMKEQIEIYLAKYK